MIELLRTIYLEQTDEELELIIAWCKNKNLDPVNKPCYIKRDKNNKLQLVPTLNGYIAIAQNSGMLGGISEPKYLDDQSCTVTVTRHSPIPSENGGGISYSDYTASPVYFADYAFSEDHKRYPKMYLANWALSKSLKLAFADIIGGLPTDVELNSAISFSDKHTTNVQPVAVRAELPVSPPGKSPPPVASPTNTAQQPPGGLSFDLDALLSAVDKKTTPPIIPVDTTGIAKETIVNISDILAGLPTKKELTITGETNKKVIGSAENCQMTSEEHGEDLGNLIACSTEDLDLDAIFAD